MKSRKKLEEKLGKNWEQVGNMLGTRWNFFKKNLKSWKKIEKKLKKVEKKLEKSWKKVPEYVKDPEEECS